MDGVEVHRYRYAPERWQTLVNDGGIVTNLKLYRWKSLLVPAFVLSQAWVAFRLRRRLKVDVVHAHWIIPQGFIAAFLQAFPGSNVPFVVTSHGADLYALSGRLLDSAKRFVLRRAAAITVVSSAMLGKLQALGASLDNVSILPMGVDLEGRFVPDPQVVRSNHEILFVGRLVEKKGVSHLLAAMPRVLASTPDARLVIAGFGPDEAALRLQVHDLGLEASVRFAGALPQAELPALYRSAAVFVAPFVRAASGDQEGLPVALMEAVACGCPIVAGDIPGLDDLLGDARDEVCVNALDRDALATKIVQVLTDPAAAQARAQRIRATAGCHVDWSRIADDYARVLLQSLRKD